MGDRRKEHPMTLRKGIRFWFVTAAALGLGLSCGCAATDGALSNEKVWQANKAIGAAKESNASQNAPVELRAAEDRIIEATTALTNKDYEKAVRLAEEASADAEYARAKATAEKARKKAEEMRQNLETLRQEVERTPQ